MSSHSTQNKASRLTANFSRPLAGVLTILASIVMIFYGFGFSLAYISSINYYHTRVFDPALYIGIWNSCAFPFTLAGGIFLIKKKHFMLSIVGITLALASGFVPMIVLAVFPNYVWTNGLPTGLPLMILSIVALIAVAVSRNKLEVAIG